MPALTVGMATYDDFDGVWFTIQALRLYQDLDDVELLVVDNYGCDTTRDFLENWTPARYLRSTDVQGTAAPRDLVFREASGDAVLCCDSHVMFEPGVIARLKGWFAAHPGTPDLLQGPLVSDDLGSIATHFEPVWRAQMWGIWETDPRGLDRDGEPFEIPMQGLGAFACRREVWPGFNRRFSGFGGEEGYIHEKFRQAGGRTLCLPWLRWSHRFGRPKGVTYRNTFEDRLRNYVVGHAELGLDIAPIVENFSEVLSEEQIQRVVTEALWPESAVGGERLGEGEDGLPFLVALCPTYRRRRLVENAVACFEGQDYPPERRRLLVLDDFGDLGAVDEETWSVVSVADRLESLPAKYARLAELATERWPEVDAFVLWEDDDVYLPGHLRAHGEVLRSAQWSKPSTVLSTYGGTLHEEAAAGRFFASVAFRASLLARVGGFVQTARGDFDQQFLSTLEGWAGAPGDPAAGRGPTYVFRWEGTEFAHAEAFMTGPDDETWYAKAGEAARTEGADSPDGPGAPAVVPLMDDQTRELWQVHETAGRGGEPLVP